MRQRTRLGSQPGTVDVPTGRLRSRPVAATPRRPGRRRSPPTSARSAWPRCSRRCPVARARGRTRHRSPERGPHTSSPQAVKSPRPAGGEVVTGIIGYKASASGTATRGLGCRARTRGALWGSAPWRPHDGLLDGQRAAEDVDRGARARSARRTAVRPRSGSRPSAGAGRAARETLVLARGTGAGLSSDHLGSSVGVVARFEVILGLWTRWAREIFLVRGNSADLLAVVAETKLFRFDRASGDTPRDTTRGGRPAPHRR